MSRIEIMRGYTKEEAEKEMLGCVRVFVSRGYDNIDMSTKTFLRAGADPLIIVDEIIGTGKFLLLKQLLDCTFHGYCTDRGDVKGFAKVMVNIREKVALGEEAFMVQFDTDPDICKYESFIEGWDKEEEAEGVGDCARGVVADILAEGSRYSQGGYVGEVAPDIDEDLIAEMLGKPSKASGPPSR